MPSYSTSSGPFENNPVFNRDRVVVITGGSGKLGRATVAHFVAQTPRIYVISLDLFPPPKSVVQPDAFVTVDLTDSGKVLEALMEVDLKYKLDPRGTNQIGIVHLAALPTPGQAVNSVMFQTNVMCTYNILEASRKLGFTNLTLASSVTLAGLPFEPRPMDKLPVSEDSQPPYPSHSYSLSKLMGEVMADQYCRWNPELKVCSMRISWVKEEVEYPLVETMEVWRKELFGYIDSRDAAHGMLCAYESQRKGHDVYYIAGDDHSLGTTPTAEIIKTHYPGVPYTPASKNRFEGLVDCSKAKKELGWNPKHTWRTYAVNGDALLE